jgi:aminopeptidase-like protein
MEFVLAETGGEYRIDDFSPYGYDERQYCSPGFDLPVGRFGRGQHGEYPEYHTSADDLSFVDEPSLEESWRLLRRFVEVLEANGTYRNQQPYGEPQLGRRGLYRSIGSTMDPKAAEMGLLWVLSLADGSRSVLDIARRSGLPFDVVAAACRQLLEADLLAPEPG